MTLNSLSLVILEGILRQVELASLHQMHFDHDADSFLEVVHLQLQLLPKLYHHWR